ncbi:MAG: formate dehydrogenase subunit gamma [Pseudomonadota bacterium]
MLTRFFAALLLILPLLAAPASAQQAPASDRSSTGGAQTLEDILARQAGQSVESDFRREAIGNPGGGAGLSSQLGTLGGASDAEMFRALRYNAADIIASNNGPAADVLIQDTGMFWLTFRSGPLKTWGGLFLLFTIGAIAVFWLLRGKIRIDGEKTGRTILRFNSLERFAHWTMALSFILLGITGLVSLFGRLYIIPVFGKEAFATLALYSKWVHNNVAWAFMLGLIMAFVFWVVHNIPNRADLYWMSKGGGLFSKGVHPPAKKFNAGQKVIFWSTILMGASISLTGLALLFPFEINLFAKTFGMINAVGLPGLVGMEALPTILAPHTEMQLAQAWHAIMAFVLMAIIIAHIYLGSVGMEGAYDAMGSGEVEEQWAKEHHSIWYAEEKAKQAEQGANSGVPAE